MTKEKESLDKLLSAARELLGKSDRIAAVKREIDRVERQTAARLASKTKGVTTPEE